MRVDNRGRGIARWGLLAEEYRVGFGEDATPIELVTRDDENTIILATPLKGLGIGNLSEALFRVEGRGTQRIVFVLERNGIEVRKIFQFYPDSYMFELELEIGTSTDRPIKVDIDLEWAASSFAGKDFTEQALDGVRQEECY